MSRVLCLFQRRLSSAEHACARVVVVVTEVGLAQASVHVLVSTPLTASSASSQLVPLSHSVLRPVSLREMALPPLAMGLCTTLMIFGMTVEDVLCNTEWSESPQNLECVEIFAGVGSVAAAASELNLRAATYDKNRIPGSTEATEDLTTEQGFHTAIALVMRLVPGGLLWLAPVCTTWGFLSSSRCKRDASNGYEGDPSCTSVVAGNAMVRATVFLMLLAARREVRAAMENPVHSIMFRYHLVRQVETALAMTSAIAYRCAYSSAPYGSRYLKGYRFLAIGKWIRGVAARCRCPSGLHLPLVINKIGSDGKRRVTGIKKRLRESGAYPLDLGRKIVECATPGRPLQPSDRPETGAVPADRSTLRRRQCPMARRPASSTKATRVRKDFVKKIKSRAVVPRPVSSSAVQRPVSSSVLRPVPNVSAPSWLQPSASAARTSGRFLGSVVRRPSWRAPVATRKRRSPAAASTSAATPTCNSRSPVATASTSATPAWLTPTAEWRAK